MFKCLELAKKVELEEDDVDFLLQTIGEELSKEDLVDELVKQWDQLEEEEEVEAGQQPTTPSMIGI